MQRNTCSTSKLPAIEELQVGQESASKTGHALLKQGALSILTLSKRGFFMAGKVNSSIQQSSTISMMLYLL